MNSMNLIHTRLAAQPELSVHHQATSTVLPMEDPHLTIMLSAPSGVTNIAGAKAYAAKFAISPTIIIIMPDHHSGSARYE